MGKKHFRRKKKLSKRITSNQKGKLVELITASLHDWLNVKVERNVFFP